MASISSGSSTSSHGGILRFPLVTESTKRAWALRGKSRRLIAHCGLRIPPCRVLEVRPRFQNKLMHILVEITGKCEAVAPSAARAARAASGHAAVPQRSVMNSRRLNRNSPAANSEHFNSHTSCLNHRHCLSLTQNFFDATCTPLRVRIMTQSAASKALDTSVRKLSCILCLCEDVRMTSTGNDNRLDAQDPTRLRLLPLWPDLVISRSRNVHVVDLRQRFQRTDFVEADHGMSG